MRSRYVAYVQRNELYLLATWHASTRPTSLDLESEPQPRWIGLTVMHFAMQSEDRATVEFTARYRLAGRAHRLHEISRFIREAGRWFYLDGEVMDGSPPESR